MRWIGTGAGQPGVGKFCRRMDDTWAGERERPTSGVMQAWVTVNQAA
jgi:hypothetical protein